MASTLAHFPLASVQIKKALDSQALPRSFYRRRPQLPFWQG
jgi:hypothetical protein